MPTNPYASKLSAAAQKYGLDPDLVMRQAHQESGYNPNSLSNKGAIGIMQLMPETAKGLGVDPNDIDQNIDGGVRYLKQMHDRYGGDTNLALAAYNAGPGRVDQFVHGGRSLPSETTDYVQKINGGVMNTPSVAQPAPSQPAPGAKMADPNQDLSVFQKLMQGGPGALIGAPEGVFPDAQGNAGGGYDLGNALKGAGAGLVSISNPSGGAALMNAANMPLMRNRFSIVSDPYGGQRVFDLHRGTFVGGVPGSPGGSSATGTGDTTTDLAHTPKAMVAKLEQDQKDSADRMRGLEDAALEAQSMIDSVQQAKRLSQDPHVFQGAFGNAIGEGKSILRTVTGGLVEPAGTAETQSKEKLDAQIQAQFLGMQKGARFAGPEIKFSASANADNDKLPAVNQQIYDDMIQKGQRMIAARDIGRRHIQTRNVLGPEYSKELQDYVTKNPINQDTAVIPTAPSSPNRPSLDSIFK